MDIVHASAPGKIVLCGEYAVLAGAPALTMAVDARAGATLEDSCDGVHRVVAPDIGITEATFDFDASGRVLWRELDEGRSARARLIARVIENFGANLRPFRATLDTSAFSRSGTKLGLGSSAAITVALAGALCARAGSEPPRLESLIALHRAWQGGGSGLDIAASVCGGLSMFRVRAGEPSVEAIAWPNRLHVCFVWCGEVADTGAKLRRLSEWRACAADSHEKHMTALARGAEAAAESARLGDAARLLLAIGDYAKRLRDFSNAASLDIFTAGHDALSALAERSGVIYKPCGAGGDVGVALSVAPSRLDDFRLALRAAGFRDLDLHRAERGVRVRHETPTFSPEPQAHAGRHLATTC